MFRRPYRLRRAGRFNFGPWLLLLLLMAFVYLLVVCGPIYLHKQRMEEATRLIVQRAARQHLELIDVKAQLQEQARAVKLPAEHRIDVSRNGQRVTARVAYTERILLPHRAYEWPIEIEVEDLGY